MFKWFICALFVDKDYKVNQFWFYNTISMRANLYSYLGGYVESYLGTYRNRLIK